MKKILLLLYAAFIFSCSDDDTSDSLPENALLTYSVNSTVTIETVTYKDLINTQTFFVDDTSWEYTRDYTRGADAFVSAMVEDSGTITVEIIYDGEVLRSSTCATVPLSSCSAATVIE